MKSSQLLWEVLWAQYSDDNPHPSVAIAILVVLVPIIPLVNTMGAAKEEPTTQTYGNIAFASGDSSGSTFWRPFTFFGWNRSACYRCWWTSRVNATAGGERVYQSHHIKTSHLLWEVFWGHISVVESLIYDWTYRLKFLCDRRPFDENASASSSVVLDKFRGSQEENRRAKTWETGEAI